MLSRVNIFMEKEKKRKLEEKETNLLCCGSQTSTRQPEDHAEHCTILEKHRTGNRVI